MLALSPRAVERLNSYTPPWPLPKLFRMTKAGGLDEALFEGDTVNTPSMLAVEDALDGLGWAESIGGLPALIRRSEANLAVLSNWVERTPWIEFLALDPKIRSSTSVCFSFADPWFRGLAADARAAVAKSVADRLDSEGVAHDIGAYREAPPGLRIWAGSTVEAANLEALTPWLDWAYARAKSRAAGAA
jgi:phosphoserine aminotransferase